LSITKTNRRKNKTAKQVNPSVAAVKQMTQSAPLFFEDDAEGYARDLFGYFP
jgi:hypothetical protein